MGFASKIFLRKLEIWGEEMKKNNLKLVCVTGVFTAIVFVFTAYIHIPSYTGYVHVGDGIIYLAASVLPLPYAVFIGAGGAALADCLSGFALWAPGSAIIKAATVFFFCRKSEKILNRKNLIALIPAAVICVGGYYLYESIVTGSFAAPLAGIPGNIIQSVLSSVFYLILGRAFDRLKIKKMLGDREV